MRAAGGARQAVHDLRRLKCDAGSGVDAQLIALELMKGSSRHIMDKANKYKRVGAEKKKQSIMAKHKFAWQKESKQLDAERRALERDLWEVEVPGVFDLAQLERERSELSLETEALGDSIWNDYQEIVALVGFIKLRHGEERRVMEEHCRKAMEQIASRMQHGLDDLEREGDELEVEISALQHGRLPPSPSHHARRCPSNSDLVPLSRVGDHLVVDASSGDSGDGGDGGAVGSRDGCGVCRSAAASVASDDGEFMVQAAVGSLEDDLTSLDARYLAQLDELRAQYEADGGSCSTFSKRANEVYEKVLREFSRAGERGVEGRRRTEFLERVTLELAAGGHVHSAAELEVHARKHEALRFEAKRRRALLRSWREEKRSAIEAAQCELERRAATALAELERGVELAAFEASRAALHERLRELRAETAARKGVEAEAEAARLQQELDAQHRAEEAWRVAMTKKRAAIETWRVRQEEEAVACLAREEMNKALALEDYQAEAERNAERVAYRKNEWDERQRAAAAAAEAKHEAEEARLDALDALAATVAPTVERDPKRVLMDTEATRAMTREDQEYFRTQERAGRHAVHGYTSKQVMRDQRTKLTQALVSAGLQNSAYAREALRAVAPARNISMHLTSAQRTDTL